MLNVAKSYNLMSRRAQKLPELYQEGTYKRRKSGKVVNVGKPIKGPAGNASAAAADSTQPLRAVPLQHFGQQNDMDTGLDGLDLDPNLPSREEMRQSYGKVRSPNVFMNPLTVVFQRHKISTWKCGSRNARHISTELLWRREPIATHAVAAAQRPPVGDVEAA